MNKKEIEIAKACTVNIDPLKEHPINKGIKEINTAPTQRHFNPEHGLSRKEREIGNRIFLSGSCSFSLSFTFFYPIIMLPSSHVSAGF